MVYTCYEMIRDCRANKPEGWSFFLAQYVPVIRGLLAHYFPERAGDPVLVERILAALRQPQASLFESLDPAPERAFVAGLRQRVLAAVEADRAGAAPEVPIDLEVLGAALEPLTLTEKQVVWFEVMGYSGADAARMLRMSEETTARFAAARSRTGAVGGVGRLEYQRCSPITARRSAGGLPGFRPRIVCPPKRSSISSTAAPTGAVARKWNATSELAGIALTTSAAFSKLSI